MMVRKIFILYQIKEKSMSMWELLINDEVIDRVDLIDSTDLIDLADLVDLVDITD